MLLRGRLNSTPLIINKEEILKIRGTQRRALSFLLAFLIMFSSIHPVFANSAPEPKDELEISDELIEPEEMSVKEFNKIVETTK